MPLPRIRSELTQRVAVIGLFVLIAILVIFPMRDYDTFWYLANGRALFETGKIVDREIFSYTAYGTPFRNISWLGQYLMYLAFRWGGPDGIIGFKVVVTMVVSFLLYRTGRILGAPRIWAALLMVFVIYAQLWRFVERTQIFSYLLLALLSLILHGWRAGKLPDRVIWFVPVIMVAWDLFHGSVYGLTLLLAMLAGESVTLMLKKRTEGWPGLQALSPERYRNLLIAVSLAMFLMVVSPYGLLHGNLPGFLNLVNGETEAKYVGEFLPPGWNQYRPFWMLMGMVVLSMVTAGRSFSLVWLFITIPFAALAVRYCRSIEAFGLVTYPILAISAARYAEWLDKHRPLLHKILISVTVVLVAAYLLHFKFVQQQYRYTMEENIDDFSFRLGINEYYFPVGSVRFIVDNNVQGRMFNSDRYGGYLAYFLAPERPIFQYNHPTLFRHVYGYLHNPAERRKYGITYAIVAREDEFEMFQREGFVPVYWEPTAMVLLKPTLENRELIQRYAIRHFQPLMEDKEFRRIAADPRALPRLMLEISDYLACREDTRVATLFVELLRRNNAIFDASQRQALLERVRRCNGGNPSLPPQ